MKNALVLFVFVLVNMFMYNSTHNPAVASEKIAMYTSGGTSSSETESEEGYGTIMLQIEGLRHDLGGAVSAGIFTRDFFPQVGKASYEQYVTFDGTTRTIVFDFVPSGVYAAAVFQDVDMDGDLRTNFVGLPREPIGFSNDVRIRFGPPAFSDAAFNVVNGDTVRMRIILR